jgi:hypothetical protein
VTPVFRFSLAIVAHYARQMLYVAGYKRFSSSSCGSSSWLVGRW